MHHRPCISDHPSSIKTKNKADSSGDPREDPRYMLCNKSGINGHLARPFDVKTCPKAAHKYRADFWRIKNAKQPHQRRVMSEKLHHKVNNFIT